MKFVNTSHVFSNIQARDAIFVDTVIQLNKSNKLILKGTVFSELVSSSSTELLTSFEFIFKDIKNYECVNLDFSKLDAKMNKNFMLLENSQFIKDYSLSSYKHYVLSTYSYVYQIVAKDYEFNLTTS